MNKIKKFLTTALSLLLSLSMLIPNSPAYLGSPVFALSEEAQGFDFDIEWGDSEFTNGDEFNLAEDENTSNAVKMRVSYTNRKVKEDGYKEGELIITVKGIGNVLRDGVLEAVVGADKAGSGTQNRDWTYSYNKATDTYTFTNNKAIQPNSVFSGYFDLVWNIGSRTSMHQYSQDDIQAELILPSGEGIESNTLTFTNETHCDEYQDDINTAVLYGDSGITSGIENPDDYIFIKYSLDGYKTVHSRGVSENETFIFDPDSTGVGSGAIVISPHFTTTDLGNGTYQPDITFSNGGGSQSTGHDDFLYVAYPKDSYSGQTVKASLEIWGIFNEGDDSGNTDLVQVAYDDIDVNVPTDFSFIDLPGDTYDHTKDSYYQKNPDPAYAEQGGHIPGYTVDNGTTQTFYLEGFLNVDGSSRNIKPFDLELVDDYLFITQNDGTFRQLRPDEYEFRTITLPGTASLLNVNGLPIQSDYYDVEVYAYYDGETVDLEGGDLVYSDTVHSNDSRVYLPAGTTAFRIVLYGMEESMGGPEYPEDGWSIPVDVYINTDSDNDNLTEGMIKNISFIKLYYYDEEGNEIWFNDGFTADEYADDTNLHLAQKDYDTYGYYLDREDGAITLYSGQKSNYRAYTSIGDIVEDRQHYSTTFTMGADFMFKESETPDQFSLYSVLPEGLSIKDFEIDDDLVNNTTLSGMGLDEATLWAHCVPEIIENYQDSGRTYVALHFDFSDIGIPQNTSIRAAINCDIEQDWAKDQGTQIRLNGKSAVMMDKEVNQVTLSKYPDDGRWDYDAGLSEDIDMDGDIEELLAYNADYTSRIIAESSQFELSKFVKTEYSDGWVQLPDVPYTVFNHEYSYDLSVRNGNSKATNIVVYDSLEDGPNRVWQGTFESVDLSRAEKLGLTGTVYYSTKQDPSDDLTSADWTTDKPSTVHAVAVDFGESVLDEGAELSIRIKMTAPADPAYKNKITENNFKTELCMIDSSTGGVTDPIKLESNYVQVILQTEPVKLIVTKKDEVDESLLTGATFQLIRKSDNEIVGEGTSNAKGQIVFSDVPSDETYILHEVTAPQGYDLREDEEVYLDGTSFVVRKTAKDPRKKGVVKLTKSSSFDTSVKVQGAEYTLYDKEGNVVQTKTTDINGVLTFDELEWGTYTLKETVSPDGYGMNSNPRTVIVGRDTVAQEIKVSVTDPQDETQLTFTKYAMNTQNVQLDTVLKAAVFDLVRIVDGNPVIVGTYVTDKNGRIIIEDLPYGAYELRETRAPAGYDRMENLPFTVSPSNKEIELKGFDKRKPGAVYITKTDNLGNRVEGVTFELYDENKTNVVGTYTTDGSGLIQIQNLEWGTYYLKEKEVPEYYQLDSTWHELTIDGAHLNIDMSIENQTKKGKIKLIKTDEIGIVRLQGAEFTLYKDDGSVIQEGLTTDENGELTVENLEWGKYYFKETKAPTGYGLSEETIRFSVNSINCSTEQEILVEDPEESKLITVTKEIRSDDIQWENGDPTFLFKVTGTDINGNEHEYYRIMRFDQAYVEANAADGIVRQSVTFSGLAAGEYTASEEETARYRVNSIKEVSSNGTINENELTVTFELVESEEGSTTFSNEKYEGQWSSDTGSVANVIKRQRKLTAIKVDYLGDYNVEARSVIDRSLIRVTAIYDDDTTRILENNEWAFGDGITNETYPNVNGVYNIPIKYSEGGITKHGDYEVEIYGAYIPQIIRLDVAVNEGYETVKPGQELTDDMYTVIAVYDDGSTKQAWPSTTLHSPNYPKNYDNNMDETWSRKFEGAAKVLVKVEYPMYGLYNGDNIYIKDENGNVLRTIAGNTTGSATLYQDVDGDTVVINFTSNGWSTGSGYTITFTPLDENNNPASPPFDYVRDTQTAPNSEGAFDVDFHLTDNPDVAATVSQNAKYPDPILLKGQDFAWGSRAPYFSSDTNVVFTDAVAPAGVTTSDLSEAEDNSVVGWTDGSTYYISSQRPGVKVIANSDSSYLFYYRSNVASIDLSYLDTSRVTTMRQMFYGCSSLTTLDVSSLDTHNVTNMQEMFSQCSNLTSVNLGSINLSSVETMQSLFNNCTKLTSVDLSGLNQCGATSIYGMFNKCRSLTSVNLDGFNTSNVENMGNMFQDCSSLTTLDLSVLDTSSVNHVSSMFQGCSNLRELNLAGFDTSRVTAMTMMFYQCSSLNSLDLTGFDTSNVTSMYMMFQQCSNLRTLDLSSFDLSSVASYGTMNMFTSDYSLTTAYARTQEDADKLNSSQGKPSNVNFIVKP